MCRFMTKERGVDAVEEEGGSVRWAMRGPPAPLWQGRAVRHAGRRGAVSLTSRRLWSTPRRSARDRNAAERASAGSASR
jgi:hypothetical protein